MAELWVLRSIVYSSVSAPIRQDPLMPGLAVLAFIFSGRTPREALSKCFLHHERGSFKGTGLYTCGGDKI